MSRAAINAGFSVSWAVCSVGQASMGSTGLCMLMALNSAIFAFIASTTWGKR